MNQSTHKYIQATLLIFILAGACFISGCAPLLIGAGAVGGYHMAKEH